MARKAKRKDRKRPERVEEQEPEVLFSDFIKARLGYTPSTRPFHTTAKRACGGCHAVKPGAEFDVPITPGRQDLNLCRECAAPPAPR
jgi:hypothetical protein